MTKSNELPRYPDYDVLRKRDGMSWNDATREVLDARLAVSDTGDAPRFLDPSNFNRLRALADTVVPQGLRSGAVPLAALVDDKLRRDARDGYRRAGLPPLRDAWTIGLAALEHEAQARHATPFARLAQPSREAIVEAMQQGSLDGPHWHGMSSKLFFSQRVMHDIASAYYGHPHAWNEIGFGGPAAPRGYVRMDFNRRDPWEASEAHDDAARAQRENRRAR